MELHNIMIIFRTHVVLYIILVLETVIVKNVLQMKDLRIKVQLLIQQITCYKNVNYRKYYDCMYGLPLQKPDSSTIKSNLGSAEISGLNHIADEGVWVPFSDHLQDFRHSFDMDNEREQYGIQNNLNLGTNI